MAKADLKEIEVDPKRRVGQAVERAFKLANLSQKEVAAKLGHNDSAQVNRWIAGTERPQFDALFAIESLRAPIVIALAEMAGEGVEVTTHISVRRTA
jgi:transcriptional regulator with XRE-family HTH domain